MDENAVPPLVDYFGFLGVCVPHGAEWYLYRQPIRVWRKWYLEQLDGSEFRQRWRSEFSWNYGSALRQSHPA